MIIPIGGGKKMKRERRGGKGVGSIPPSGRSSYNRLITKASRKSKCNKKKRSEERLPVGGPSRDGFSSRPSTRGRGDGKKSTDE